MRFTSPLAAAEAGEDAVAWHIDRIKHDLDHMWLHCPVDVFDAAGFDAVPMVILKAHRAAEIQLEQAREAVEGLLRELEKFQEQRKAQAEKPPQALTHDTLRAKRIELIDDQGRVRASLAMTEDRDCPTPDFMLLDRHGDIKAALGLMPWTDEGQGNNELGILQFNPPQGEFGSKAMLSAEPDGSLSLDFNDARYLHINPDGSATGPDGQTLIQRPKDWGQA